MSVWFLRSVQPHSRTLRLNRRCDIGLTRSDSEDGVDVTPECTDSKTRTHTHTHQFGPMSVPRVSLANRPFVPANARHNTRSNERDVIDLSVSLYLPR